ncbi:MAG: helix-turn-helix transcriptional regulator [bacterium]
MKFSELLHITRKEKGYTLLELAQRSGLSYSMLYRLEDGDIQNPHPEILQKIAEPLTLDYEELLEMLGYINQKKNTPPSSKIVKKITEVPIVSWDLIEKLEKDEWNQCQYLSKQNLEYPAHQHPLVAIQIQRPAFLPMFRPKDLVIFQQSIDQNYRSDHYILYKNQHNELSIAKTYVHQDNTYGQDLNQQNDQTLFLLSQVTVLATVVGQQFLA